MRKERRESEAISKRVGEILGPGKPAKKRKESPVEASPGGPVTMETLHEALKAAGGGRYSHHYQRYDPKSGHAYIDVIGSSGAATVDLGKASQ